MTELSWFLLAIGLSALAISVAAILWARRGENPKR